MGNTSWFVGAPKRNRGAESRVTPNFWSERFVEKLNILSRSGFSWLGAVIQAVGNALGDFPSSSWGWTEFSKTLLLGLVSSWSIRFSKLCISESNSKGIKISFKTLLANSESKPLRTGVEKILVVDRDENRHTLIHRGIVQVYITRYCYEVRQIRIRTGNARRIWRENNTISWFIIINISNKSLFPLQYLIFLAIWSLT